MSPRTHKACKIGMLVLSSAFFAGIFNQSNIYAASVHPYFPDEKFYSDIVAEYNYINRAELTDEDVLTDEQLDTITYLYEGGEIVSFEGIEHLQNLERLWTNPAKASDCTITNEAIRNLASSQSIEKLYLTGCNIDDEQFQIVTETVSDMPNVHDLSLSDNNITSISPLLQLSNITSLDLSSNHITAFSSLVNLPNLRTLSIDANYITDLSSLQDLTSLEALSVGNNYIEDISALSGMSQLSSFSARNNFISDLTPLNGKPLTQLELGHNKVSDFSILDTLNSARINASHQTLDMTVHSATVELPLIFQQAKTSGFGDGNSYLDATVQMGYLQEFISNEDFELTNAKLSSDGKSVTILDLDEPAKIKIVDGGAANTVLYLYHEESDQQADDTEESQESSGEEESSAKTPDTGLFTDDDPGTHSNRCLFAIPAGIMVAIFAYAVFRKYRVIRSYIKGKIEIVR